MRSIPSQATILLFVMLCLGFYIGTNHLKLNPHYAQAFYKQAVDCKAGCPDSRRERYLRKAIFYDPLLTDAYYDLGVLAEQNGHSLEAFSFYEKVTQLVPRHPDAYFSVGYYYFVQKDLDHALRYLLQALRYRHLSLEIHYYLGRVYEARQEYEKAEFHYEQALREEGKIHIPDAARARIRLHQGFMYHQMGNDYAALRRVPMLRELGREDWAQRLERHIKEGQDIGEPLRDPALDNL